MSNIIQNKNDFLLLKEILNHFQNNTLTKTYLEEVFKNLLPNEKNKLLINYNIREKGFTTAKFVASTKSINMSINEINIWLENNTHDFLENFKINDPNILRSYLLLFVITHEIEHSYQYLIGEGMIETSNTLLKNAYKGLYDLFNKDDYIIPRPIKQTRKNISLVLYKLRENLYVLERNANIESMDLLSKCALYNNMEDIYQLFTDMKNTYLKCGYINNNMGSIEETYRKLLMYDKYKKIYHEIEMSEDERIRYGFNINEETRNKLLRKSS